MTARRPDRDPPLDGLRVLLVEDEGAISLLLESLLETLGCRVVGVASVLDDALRIAETAELDVALLDVNVTGQPVYPVAERLAVRGVPIIFSTGYGAAGLAARWRTTPVLVKPFTARQLETALRKVRRAAGPDV